MSLVEVGAGPLRSGAAHRVAQRLATREKLLSVCVAEFQRNGFAQTDVASIVKAAGVSRGTFYFHFPTKEDVLAELRLREERRIVEQVSPLLSTGESLEGILAAVVAGILEAEQDLGSDILRAICAVQFRPEIVDADSFDKHPVAQLVLTAVARFGRKRRTRVVDQEPGDLALLFLIGVFGLLSTSNGPSADRDRLIRSLISVTVKGVSRA